MDNVYQKDCSPSSWPAFLLCYVGYQAFPGVLYAPIEAETVYSHTVYETVDTQGFVIRNETSGHPRMWRAMSTTRRKTAAGWRRTALSPMSMRVRSEARMQRQIPPAQRSEISAAGGAMQSQAAADPVQSGADQQADRQRLVRRLDRRHQYAGLRPAVYDTHARLLALLNKRQMTIGKADSFRGPDRVADMRRRTA